jgi:hypothetical protein
MRGFSKAARVERKDAVQRAELDQTSHMIVLAALVRTIEQYVTPGIDPRALRMVAISGLFADSISGLAGSRQAPQLVALINRQLAQAGLQLVPVARN